MRKKRFTLIILAILAVSSLFANPTDSRRRIELKVKHRIERRSAMPSSPVAFISGSLLEIDFNIPYNKATVVISNNGTGEVILQENVMYEENVIIDLCSVLSNDKEYSLFILVDANTTIHGNFSIE